MATLGRLGGAGYRVLAGISHYSVTAVLDDAEVAELGWDEVPSLRTSKSTSSFSCHTWFRGDVDLRNLRPVRGRRISPARSALDRGVRVTLHQDTPVTPPDMLLTIWAAVNRISRTGRPVGLEQRISTWEALRAVTCEAAYQYGEEDSKGRIS